MKLNSVVKFITDLVGRKWYGKLTISIESGRITLIKKEESIREL